VRCSRLGLAWGNGVWLEGCPQVKRCVHLKVVLASRAAVSQRTPWPARHPVSGPWRTSLVHRKQTSG